MDEIAHTATCASPGEVVTGNVMPILHQVRHALHDLLETGKAEVIDLRSIPMGPGEEDRLAEALGKGEVEVRMSALGPSEIIETRYPGVWLVTHFNNDNEIIGKFIEICAIPDLVMAQDEDIRAGLVQLNEQLT